MASAVRDKDKGYRKLLRSVKGINDKASITVGVHAEEGGGQYEGGLTLAAIATIHEFGAPPVPERSFIRDWADEYKVDDYPKASANVARGIVSGKIDGDRALELLGLEMVGLCQERIRGHIAPELKQATIDRKGSETPLIDTGQLIASITHKVNA